MCLFWCLCLKFSPGGGHGRSFHLLLSSHFILIHCGPVFHSPSPSNTATLSFHSTWYCHHRPTDHSIYLTPLYFSCHFILIHSFRVTNPPQSVAFDHLHHFTMFFTFTTHAKPSINTLITLIVHSVHTTSPSLVVNLCLDCRPPVLLVHVLPVCQ